ncbi:MAG: pyrroloquinoline quinone biosynthesis protein PqqE [Gallionellales bacterium RIFCSPLOWO2_12_FULL_59_22]|nr:MAG: pyrroloquinoline quinone biosynthesis protein PqqE [Gallionellales bacterium RIFCSPLOWO2_02_FULL_59_110]OGT04289.1 MAG: pyrroloquinoline quinone biosynthesis protein PqqE [Gallionellales bacterium RIFCSPLOWO2_02_58_13]OGT13267.1 MAG: pyrroloquinoline quinone biosynthesis protein PqqE [Gallionellales bacterium RIFCSPLOWO2_12_FULL_59_22]
MEVSRTGDASSLFLLAINLTNRCNLACAHCYMDAETMKHGDRNELTAEEVCSLLDDIAARSTETMVVLTGGEPMLRGDLEKLVAHGAGLGLAMVVGTNGVALTDKRVQSLKATGAMGAGISVDSLDPEKHDAFRGLPGAWEKTMQGIEACKRHGLPFQIHFSVTESNADEVPGMIDFARASGARVLNVFFLVCTGRGESMSDISPVTYERVLNQLVAAQEQSRDLLIRARCAPHYKRIAYQRNPASTLTRAAGYEGGGCLAGIHYCRVTPEGGVTACPYIPNEDGNIRDKKFWDIWDQSPTFQSLRKPKLQGKCGSCEFRKLCGGCRARPLAMGESLMDTDPWCVHVPEGAAVIEPLAEQSKKLAWSEEAEKRLSRVPSFLRKMVKSRAESYVQELGLDTVTEEHLAVLSARRFGSDGPPRPNTRGEANQIAGVQAIGVPHPNPPPESEKLLAGHPGEGANESLREFHINGELPWSEQARERLAAMPAFLQEGVRAIAEDVARSEGRLEVNIKLLDRLESEQQPGRSLKWADESDQLLTVFLAEKAPQVRMFVAPALEGAAESFTRKRRAATVESTDVEAAIAQLTGGVEWDEDALARVLSAPDFNRAGIKKAAEFNARKEGLARITSADLTRFRNNAMMRAVQRMKGFGMQELSFNAYEIARDRVPRLKDNPEADKRFDTIRSFVAARENPGDLLGRDLLEKMKAQLKSNK